MFKHFEIFKDFKCSRIWNVQGLQMSISCAGWWSMIGRGKSTSSWLQMLASLSIGRVISRMVMISNKHQDGDGGDHNNSDIDHYLDLLLINSDFREDKKSKRHMAILKLEWYHKDSTFYSICCGWNSVLQTRQKKSKQIYFAHLQSYFWLNLSHFLINYNCTALLVPLQYFWPNISWHLKFMNRHVSVYSCLLMHTQGRASTCSDLQQSWHWQYMLQGQTRTICTMWFSLQWTEEPGNTLAWD